MLISLLAIAIASTTASSSAKSGGAATSPTPTIAFCRSTFEHVVASGTGVFAQLNQDADLAHLAGEARAEQIAVCSVYFRGMMDYIDATGPTA